LAKTGARGTYVIAAPAIIKDGRPPPSTMVARLITDNMDVFYACEQRNAYVCDEICHQNDAT
jgi:hypothetical protein